MSSSSRASQSSRSSFPAKKVCGHGKEPDILTSMTFDNPCRRFYRCPMRKQQDCTFFEWIDPALPDFQKSYLLRLKSRNESLEEQLRRNIALEKMYNERAVEKNEFMDQASEFEHKLNDLVDEVQKNKEAVLVLPNTLAVMQKLEMKLNVVMFLLFVVVLFFVLSLLGKHDHVQGLKMLS